MSTPPPGTPGYQMILDHAVNYHPAVGRWVNEHAWNGSKAHYTELVRREAQRAEDNGKLAHDLSIELDAHSKALERASRAIDELMAERDTLAEALRSARSRLAYNSLLDQHDPIDEALATLDRKEVAP